MIMAWTLARGGLAAQAPLPATGEGWTPIGSESRVWFTGASNVRRFTCRARSIEGGYRTDAAALDTLLPHVDSASAAVLTIRAARLACSPGAMNRHLREALKGDANPHIELRLVGWDAHRQPDGTTAMRLRGRLSIAGVEREVSFDAVAAPDTLGRVHVTGAQPLRVTDYGVVPPRRFLGALRVRESVTVHWDVVLNDAPAAHGAARRSSAQPSAGGGALSASIDGRRRTGR
jgi:polyisoprenoid-binding protein YceI